MRLNILAPLAFLAAFALEISLSSRAVAQPASAARDLTVPARQAVNQVVYASTATSAAAERALDARITARRQAIDALRQRLSQAGGRNAALAAELSAAQESYCAALAERDRAYALEIAVLRGAAEDIAATPEGLAALERFNANDELGALLILDRMREARARARQVRDNIESAAEGRDIATLALEARNRGKLDTAKVISRIEDITRLDPNFPYDWLELGSLYLASLRTTDAIQSFERASAIAQSDIYVQARSLQGLAFSLARQLGSATVAIDRLEQSIALLRRLDENDLPIASALIQLADILESTDQQRANQLYLEAIDISDNALQTRGTNAGWRPIALVADVYRSFGSRARREQRYEDALENYRRELEFRRMVMQGTNSADSIADFAVAAVNYGRLAIVARRDYSTARQSLDEALPLLRARAASGPTDFSWQINLADALRVTAVLVGFQTGDPNAVQPYGDEAIAIYGRLAAQRPNDPEIARSREEYRRTLMRRSN